MKQELPKVYEPQQVEGRIYEMWEKNDCFNGDPDPKKKPFSIVMPPSLVRSSSSTFTCVEMPAWSTPGSQRAE